MKRLLLMIILVLLCCHTAYADGFSLSAASIDAKAGETVNVDLTLSDNPGIIAALFELEYDRDRLTLVGAEDKGLIPGAVFGESFESYPYIMLWNNASMTDFTSNGTLVTLTFRVLENAKGGNAHITLSYNPDDVFNAELDNVEIHINNGFVNVLSEEKEENHQSGSSSSKNSSSSGGALRPVKIQNNTDSKKEENTQKTAAFISFDDVGRSDWFYDAVNYVVEKKLMSGVSDSVFAPNEPLTRGMLVAVLYRFEGSPTVSSLSVFDDVAEDIYYKDAVAWAKQNKIVSGISESEFAPDKNITREQIAAIMHRFAIYKGMDVSVGESTNILSYDDFQDISEYAIPAMQYAAGSGLMKGKTDKTLNPKDNATRAEIAAILKRFTM